MAQEWKQFVFGKIVTSLDGPIVAGKDHECTGMSEGIPEQVISSMSPSKIGPGVSDMTNWNDYLWNNEKGGIAIQSVLCDAVPWIVACRVRGRSEGGEGKIGRFYTQAHYLTIPATEFASPFLLDLADVLTANPMTQKDNHLPHICLSNQPKDLPANWLDRISIILEVLLSGLPLSIQSTKLSMKEIEELFHIVFSALPPSLSWRLSARLGAEKIHDGDTILGLGQEVHSSTRMIGLYMDDPVKMEQKLRMVDKAIKHPIHADKRIGTRYVEFLRTHASHCTNDVELQQLIQREFPHMTWDYFPLSKSFTELGVLFVQDIFERDALKQITEAQQGQGSFPDPRMFFAYRQKALLLGLQAIWGRGADFVSHTIDLWPKEWDSLPSEFTSFATLLCPNHVWDAQIIPLLREDVPPVLQERIEKGLLYQLQQKEKAAPFWSAILSQWDSLPSWTQSFLLKREQEIFIMLTSFELHSPGWLSKATMLPSCALYLECLQGIRPEKSAWQKWTSLFAKEPNRHNMLNHLTKEIFSHHTSLGCVLLDWTEEPLALTEFFRVPSLYSWKKLHTAVAEILSQQSDYTTYEIQILLVASIAKGAQNKEKIRQRLAPFMAPHMGVLLWGITSSGDDTHNQFAKTLIEFCLQNHEPLDISQNLHSEAEQVIMKKSSAVIMDFLTTNPQWKAKDQTLRVVHALMHGRTEPTHSSIDLDVFKMLLMASSNPTWSASIQSLSLLEIYMNSAQTKDTSLSMAACSHILRLSVEEQQTWIGIIQKRSLGTDTGWRLIWCMYNQLDSVVSASKEEETVLQQLDEGVQYLIFSAGISFACHPPIQPIPDAILKDVLWVSLFSKHEQRKKVILEQALAALKTQEEASFEELKTKYSVQPNFIQALWVQIQGLFTSGPSKKRPAQLTLSQACAFVLDSYPAEQRSSFFV